MQPIVQNYLKKDLWFTLKGFISWKKDGLEIKTITGSWENEKQEPCEKYLEIIKRGIKETTNWNDKKN